jgi:cytochrome P450
VTAAWTQPRSDREPVYAFGRRQDTVVAPELSQMLDALRREHGPLIRATLPVGGDGWLAISYETVKFVLSDPRFSVWRHREGDYPRVRENEGSRPPFPKSFVLMDPPDHSARRRLLTKHFSVKRVNDLRPQIQVTVDHYLRTLLEQGPGADLIQGFAQIVPVAVACDLLGAPVEDRHRFLPAASALINGTVADESESDAKIEQINAYFGELLDARRRDPGDDLISAMVADPAVAEVWTEEELRGVGFVLLFAGHDATASVLGGVLRWLAFSRELQAQLRANPGGAAQAMEEFLRFFPAGIGTRSRVALRDVRVGDVLVRADEVVLALPQAANFDPDAFDDPYQLRVEERRPRAHLRFGHGIHACLGQQLARAEIDIALRSVLSTLPAFRALDDEAGWQEHVMLRGPKTLRITW